MSLLDIFKINKKRNTYTAASKSKRLSKWNTSRADATPAAPTLDLLRSRSRDLRRNNPYANSAVSIITGYVVGEGVVAQFNDDKILDKDWKEWAESIECDYDGMHDLAGLQKLISDAVVESGEVLVRTRITPGLNMPLQLQVLEIDFLNSDLFDTSAKNGNFIIQGIEFNSNGHRVGYHLYESHPGSVNNISTARKSNFIPADQIYHILRVDRPGQVRGVPWASPVMIKLKDVDEFQDAQLMRQKIAACFTAFVQDIDSSTESNQAIEDLSDMIEPGIIEHLPAGKTIKFTSPPGVENYKEFISVELKSVATGYGITYEALTGDYSETNYSSARAGHIKMNKNIKVWRKSLIINAFLRKVEKDFKKIREISTGRKTESKATFIAPRTEMIDPSREIPAMVEEVRAGFNSRSQAIASLGRDPDDINKSIIKDNADADLNNFAFDSDPRKLTVNGKMQLNGVDNGQDKN